MLRLPLITLVFAGFLAGPLSAATVGSHPFHSSLAEMEWNPKTQSFEIALSVWPVDLEQVLRADVELKKKLDGPLSIDDQAQQPLLNEGIRAYVTQKLTARLGDTKLEPNWLGFEVERDSVWCYFELKVPEGALAKIDTAPDTPLKAEFVDTLFFELHPDQQNTILFRDRGKRHATHFDAQHPKQPVEWLPGTTDSK